MSSRSRLDRLERRFGDRTGIPTPTWQEQAAARGRESVRIRLVLKREITAMLLQHGHPEWIPCWSDEEAALAASDTPQLQASDQRMTAGATPRGLAQARGERARQALLDEVQQIRGRLIEAGYVPWAVSLRTSLD